MSRPCDSDCSCSSCKNLKRKLHGEVFRNSLDSMEKIKRPRSDSLTDVLGTKLATDLHFTDVTIVVKGTTFKKHKCVLAAGSPVIRAMLSRDFVEKGENRVEINDIDPDTFADLLEFMYTGKVSNRSRLTIDLLEAADKYDIPGLKLECEKEIGKHLEAETLTNMLITAEKYSAQNLKKECGAFLINNSRAVFATAAWMDFVNENPKLAISYIQSFMAGTTSNL